MKLTVFVAAISTLLATAAAAEVAELRAAQQYGLSYLPLMVMADRKLVEKHAKAEGLGEIKVTWVTLAAGASMNDALLSGSLHFASGGVAPLITLWDRTRTTLDVRAAAAFNAMPMFLNTRNANVRSIRDLTEQDRIALPAIKVSMMAMILQMAAAREWGDADYSRLDKLTVSMPHPDAMTALLSGGGEITGHLTSPPYQYQELERAGIRTVLNSYEVLGGPATFTVIWTTGRFYETNPKTYAAFVAALEEAVNIINKDKRAAAEFYVKATRSKESVDSVYKILADPDIQFGMVPNGIMKYANFMHKVGSIKNRPASWKDLFFPNVHKLPGS